MRKGNVGEQPLPGEKKEEKRQVGRTQLNTALRLHFCNQAQFVFLFKAPPEPAKNQPSCPTVPIESKTTASLEMQPFLHNLPDPLLKAGHFLPLRDPKSSKGHWRSCSSHFPARAELLDQCGGIFTSLLSEQGSSAREKDVSNCKKTGVVQHSQAKLMLTSALLLPHPLRIEICILQSILVLKVYADVASEITQICWKLYFSICLKLRKQRKHLGLILVPFSFNVDFPS